MKSGTDMTRIALYSPLSLCILEPGNLYTVIYTSNIQMYLFMYKQRWRPKNVGVSSQGKFKVTFTAKSFNTKNENILKHPTIFVSHFILEFSFR